MPPTSRPQPRAEILEIDAYVPGKAAPAGAGKTYKLSSNESPLGPSPKAAQAFAEIAGALALYPHGSAHALREAIGARHGLDPARLDLRQRLRRADRPVGAGVPQSPATKRFTASSASSPTPSPSAPPAGRR